MSKESAFEVGRLYLPLSQIASTLTASQKDVFVRLPGLIAYWPSGIRNSSALIDHSGSGEPLSQIGVCPTGYDGNSFVHLGSGTNYLRNPGASLAITGLETWIDAPLRGLTLGGWFALDSLPASQAGLITKYGPVTDYGYGLVVNSAGLIQAVMSSNGSAVTYVNGPIIGTASWTFLVFRFTPSAELAIFVAGTKTVNTTAIPSSVNAASQAFEVGRYANDNNFIAHARVRDAFICAAALSDSLVEEVRSTSAP